MALIFPEYFKEEPFIDRYTQEGGDGVDVIIPIISTNILWKKNLLSIYREIPVHTLYIGDGGCTDDSIPIVKEFPRVTIVDQRQYQSQGYCIKELMDKVSTDWFIYLHADVYLPEGWYHEMVKHQEGYDWFECHRKMTVMVEYFTDQYKAGRAYSGSQMGRTAAFRDITGVIEDDFLQRNEDIIFQGLIEKAGYRYGKIIDTFHYHQVTNKRQTISSMGEAEPDIKSVEVRQHSKRAWEEKIMHMQARGIIKYLDPYHQDMVDSVYSPLLALHKMRRLDWRELKRWVREVNPKWSPYVSRRALFKNRLTRRLRRWCLING